MGGALLLLSGLLYGAVPSGDRAAVQDAPVVQTDTVCATDWGHASLWWQSGSALYSRGPDPYIEYYYFAFHSLLQIHRVHAWFLFPLDTSSREMRATSAELCYYQSGGTGLISVGVSLLQDTAVSDTALYQNILLGRRLANDSGPGPNGFYRRPLNQAAARALDSCRAQGWIVMGLVAGTHNRNGETERILIDPLTSPPFLEISATDIEESSPPPARVSFELTPNPARSRTSVRLHGQMPSDVSFAVLDVSGRVVRRPAPGRVATITGLAPGVYSVVARGRGLHLTRRLVVTQ